MPTFQLFIFFVLVEGNKIRLCQRASLFARSLSMEGYTPPPPTCPQLADTFLCKNPEIAWNNFNWSCLLMILKLLIEKLQKCIQSKGSILENAPLNKQKKYFSLQVINNIFWNHWHYNSCLHFMYKPLILTYFRLVPAPRQPCSPSPHLMYTPLRSSLPCSANSKTPTIPSLPQTCPYCFWMTGSANIQSWSGTTISRTCRSLWKSFVTLLQMRICWWYLALTTGKRTAISSLTKMEHCLQCQRHFHGRYELRQYKTNNLSVEVR